MQLAMRSRVEVAIDVLESEALCAETMGNTLRVIRYAAENSSSDIIRDITGACWLLEQVMSMHEDVLRAAARGEMKGPGPETKEGAAS